MTEMLWRSMIALTTWSELAEFQGVSLTQHTELPGRPHTRIIDDSLGAYNKSAQLIKKHLF